MKKNLFLAVFLLFVMKSLAHAAIYYVDCNGSDSYDGNEQTHTSGITGPWKTISKVSNSTFGPGDQILLKSGCTFTDATLFISSSGTSNNPITFSSYGLGDKPKIKRSFLANSTSNWTDLGSNVWQSTHVFSVATPTQSGSSSFPAAVFFDNDTSYGYEVWTEGELNTQGYWWSDDANRILKMYSVGNPASLHLNIEITFHQAGVYIKSGVHDVTVSGLHPDHVGWTGIGIWQDNYKIIITDNDVSYFGAGHDVGKTSRNGNGIDFQMNAHDVTIARNKIWEGWDVGIAFQGYILSDKYYYNINIYDNLIWKIWAGFYYFHSQPNITVTDVHFYNNTIYGMGTQWAESQRRVPPEGGLSYGIYLNSGGTGIFTNFKIYNNIISGITGFEVMDNTGGTSKVDMDYNMFDVSNDASTYPHFIASSTSMSFAGYKAATGHDAHSVSGNPLFVSTSTPDFHLRAGSPAISTGVDVGLTSDYAGNPIRGLPDIGAYEYQTTKVSNPPMNLR